MDSDQTMCLVRKWRSKKSPSTNQEFACHFMTGKPRQVLFNKLFTYRYMTYISSVAATCRL